MIRKLFIMLFMLSGMILAAADQLFYAAPQALGNGSGSDPDNAAAIRNEAFWSSVNAALAQSPVTVKLVEGEYLITHPGKDNTIRLSKLGNPDNRLTISGQDKKTVFLRNPEDSRSIKDASNFANLVTLYNSQNITIEKLYFTGEGIVGYGLQVRACNNILIRDCRWENMPGVSYGASGANGFGLAPYGKTPNCSNITWENCYFKTVGYDSHAHMLYNANYCNNLTMRNCDFIDVTGDYVRFRNGGENLLIENCRFLDTGKAPAAAYPFISVPLFNSRPDKNEHFAKKLTVRNCDFNYQAPKPRSFVILYHISGMNAQGENYIFSPEDSKAMAAMNYNAGRANFLNRLHVDLADIIYQNNKVKGAKDTMVYECWPKDSAGKPLPKTLTSITKFMNR